MNRKDLELFRARLTQERDNLGQELHSHSGFSKPQEGDNLLDPEEQATRANSELVDERVSNDRGNLLRAIDHAVERLDAGVYDKCERCGNLIPIERLEAKPSAALCVNCQEAAAKRVPADLEI